MTTTFPVTRDERIALGLWPFKVFSVLGYPAVWLVGAMIPGIPRWFWASDVVSVVASGYVVSLVALFVGVLIQILLCRCRGSDNTVAILCVGLGLLWQLMRWTVIV
ncbi:hypothetical protein GC207_05645 [bacterium]|nr:hypothetical protein [bacterium]